MLGADPFRLTNVGLFIHQIMQPQVAACHDVNVALGARKDNDVFNGFTAAGGERFVNDGF